MPREYVFAVVLMEILEAVVVEYRWLEVLGEEEFYGAEGVVLGHPVKRQCLVRPFPPVYRLAG